MRNNQHGVNHFDVSDGSDDGDGSDNYDDDGDDIDGDDDVGGDANGSDDGGDDGGDDYKAADANLALAVLNQLPNLWSSSGTAKEVGR